MTSLVGLVSTIALLTVPASAGTINVPADQPTIGAAISAAASGDTILVADGTYAAQNVLTSKVLTIKSVNGPSSTIVNCGGNYFGTYQGNGTLIQGFTFQNSTSSLGVIALQTSASIDKCIFKNNNSGFNFSPACINTAGNSNTVGITNCLFDQNSGLGAVQANSILNISDSTFTNNTGQFGSGAIYANTANGHITRCVFSGNQADSNDQGGAIYWVNGPLTCTNCTFTNNSSGAAGGAVEIGAQGLDSPLTLMNCLFASNSAPKGGAVSQSVSSNHTSSITAVNCVFTGNFTNSDGTAIDSTGNIVSVSLNVTNCSFYGNGYTGGAPSAQGVISADGSTAVSISNTILYGDLTPLEISTLHTPSSITVQFTDINQAGFAGSNGNVNADPLYIDPANGNLHIPAASPAAHTGTASGAPTTDILGSTRPTPPSMGAYDLITPTHFLVDIPDPSVSYSNIQTTVTAVDDLGNIATGYNGTVTFTSSDPAYINPGPLTLVNGTGQENGAALKTAGTQTVTATDGTLSGSKTVTVVPGALVGLGISWPDQVTAGVPFNITVYGRDLFGNVVTSYNGTVHFASTDGAAVLPADTTLTNGTGTFAVTLKTGGGQTITVSDSANSFSSTTDGILVHGGDPTSFSIDAPSTTAAGAPFAVTVTAHDQFGNVSDLYGGTVHFTSSDPIAGLPADTAMSNGSLGMSAYLATTGPQTITATDTGNASLTATANSTVTPAAAASFTVSAPSSAVSGTPFSFSVTAFDAFGNTATNYTGTVHFTSADGAASLPADATLTNGAGTFSATLVTPGDQTITATDTISSATGTSGTITVSGGVATHFSVSAPANATAGASFNYTVTALDSNENVATTYSGTVHFTSTDGAASLPADATLTSGAGAFSATLTTAGSQTITATDTVTSSIAGTSGSILVGAGAVTHFTVSAPSTATSGAAFNVTVTALDAFNNTATSYSGTVHFTSTDGAASLPADTTLTSGAGTFSATLNTAGSKTITATDTVTSSITGTSGTIAVVPGAATHFTVSAPGAASTGTPFNFTVTALDAAGNTATGYTGTVHFTSSDGAASLPADATLTNGAGTFSATLNTTGSRTITATDTVTSSITGTSNAITVSLAAATHFSVTGAPSTFVAGGTFTVTVTALDALNHVVPSYNGTVKLTSTDGRAVIPANSTLTNGVKTFNVQMRTAGNQTVTATDTVNSSITGTSNAVLVTAGAPARFKLGTRATAVAGSSTVFTVQSTDAYGNPTPGYTGTVHFTSSDPAATLPADTALTNGVGSFTATLFTIGSRTITVTDASNPAITSTSAPISVVAGPATHFSVSAPSSALTGSAFNVTVTALDRLNNTATGYTGTIHFTSTDGAATLPANATLTNGAGTFSVTLGTSGSQTITATDTVTSSITGTSGVIATYSPGVNHFVVTASPSSTTAGTAVTVTVTAVDGLGNIVPSYTGTVHFTSTDGHAVLPTNSKLTNGTKTFTATLRTAMTATITGTDTVTASLTGTSNSVTLSPAAPARFKINLRGNPKNGVPYIFTVQATDIYGNATASYTGTAHFTSTDGAATLPADSTLPGGTGTFTATFRTTGTQTITLTDTVNSSITSTSAAFTVTP